MKTLLKIGAFIGITAVLFFIVCALAFYHLVRVGEFRSFVIDEIEQNTALKVGLGAADIEIGWVTGIAFRDVAIAMPDSATPEIAAERVTARVALLPLLQRQVIFYEIRLQRPTIALAGDAEGRIPLLEKLMNLPILKRPGEQFSLDLQTIKIRNGAIDYSDGRKRAGLGEWRLRQADVTVERVRGQRLREFMKDLRARPSAESIGAALHFEINSQVEKDHAPMQLKASGRLVFPQEVLDFHQAHWNADVDLVDFPAALIKVQLGAHLPIKSASGHLAQRLHLEGYPEKQLRLKGDIEFRKISVDAPELWLAPLTGVDGRTSFEAEWSREKLTIKRAELRVDDFKFALAGSIGALNSAEPRLSLQLSQLSVPLTTLRRYLPLRIIESPQWEKSLSSIQSGQVELRSAGVNATLGELRRLAQTGIDKQLWFDAELRDVSGSLAARGTLPLRGVHGRVSLQDGRLRVRDLKGAYGDSQLHDVDASYDLTPSGRGGLELAARGDFNLAELRNQLKAEFVSEHTAKIAASIDELDGRSRVDLTVKRAANEPLQFAGKVTLDKARLRYDDYALSEIKGEIAFSPKEIKGEKIRAQLRGEPVQLQLALNDYGADDGTFDLGVESTGVRAGVITQILLDQGSLNDPGIIRGAVRYRGALAHKSRRKFTGDLELVNVQLLVKPLLQPLRELNGKIEIDESGIDFHNLKALLVGVPASASGRWRYAEKPPLLFDFAAPNLDVTYLISQIDAEASEFYANLQAEGKIALAKGRIRNFEFSDMRTDATIDRRVWRLTNLNARSAGGTIVGGTTIFDRPDSLGIVALPKIQAVPVESFLRWFNITNTDMTGRVNLTGNLETTGNNDAELKQNINGTFNLRIEDGTINRMRTLVQILNLLDLSRWFTLQLPDLTKQGIRFRAITADFKVTKGIYATENLLVDSNDLRMSGAGKIDVPNDEIDLVVAVRPFAGIESAFNQVPILGRGVAAIMNSFLVGSFSIKGRIEEPAITAMPLGTLSEMFWSVLGIPKSILTLGDTEKKQEPNEPAKTPVK
ncbi:MAG TPA: AsmA-like C-terminal domain-containing protein [Candidatus Deferrimicrobium sp.]|nr:AsmA-like C-terminal domain-containing protein [Candidatus Deferrimicrobium sp.]